MKNKPAHADRRAAPRMPARFKVRYWNDGLDATGRTVNISRTGIFIQTRTLADKGTPLHLEIEVDERPFFTEGVVARVQKVSATVAPLVSSGLGVQIRPWSDVVADVGEQEAGAQEEARAPEGLTLDVRDPKRLRKILETEIKGGGVLVDTDAQHQVGEQVTLHIALPDPHGIIEAKGRVFHQRERPPGVGIEITDHSALYKRLSSLISAPLAATDQPIQMGTRFQITIATRDVPTVVGAVAELTVPCSACADLPPGGFRVLGTGTPTATPAPTSDDGLIHLDLSAPAALIEVYERQIRSGGVFVETGQTAELHETVTVYVTLPPPHGILEIKGRVVHKSTTPPGIGLELIDRVVVEAQIGPILATLGG